MHPIRRARLAADLTQPELGRLAHVSVGTLTNIECGHQPGHPHTLARLHEALADRRESRSPEGPESPEGNRSAHRRDDSA